jgi:2-polyprenyl-3-methyl-5-hydroxy-6-metoxy-1,4-benzoquinol methylase
MSDFQKYMKTVEGKPFAEKYNDARPLESVYCIVCNHSQSSLWYTMGAFNACICKKCGTKFISPRYNDEQLTQHYSSDLFTQSKDYEGVSHNMVDPRERQRKRNDMRIEINTVLKYFPQGAKILDIGCQTGIFLEALPSQYEKYGVERSEWAAEYCKKIINGNISVGRVEDVDYPQEYFDLINMSYVVEHLQYPVTTMKKVVGWLKCDGILTISVPNFSSFCSIIFREFYRLADPRQHIYLTTKRSLTKLLNDLNMTVKETYYPYWGTPYCSGKELVRLFTNSARRLLLPIYLKLNTVPTAAQIISPPFWGNILTVISVKR